MAGGPGDEIFTGKKWATDPVCQLFPQDLRAKWPILIRAIREIRS
jgi:hypothetical protein